MHSRQCGRPDHDKPRSTLEPLLAFAALSGKLRRVQMLWVNRLFRSRFVLSGAAGVLLGCAFPKISIAGLAWVGPGLILAAALGRKGSESFRIGYVGGFCCWLTSLYWLLYIPFRWHGIPLGPAVGWLGLSAYMALYPAAWVWMMTRVIRGGPFEPRTPKSGDQPAEPNLPPSPAAATGKTSLIPQTWIGRAAWAFWGAAAWVALEMVVARFLSGFPWDLLGVSQYQLTPIIQVASVTGIYGVSFLIVWFSVSLLSAGVMALRRPGARSILLAEVALPVLVLAVLFNLGFRALRQAEPAERSITVRLVQPSIPQTLIWDTTRDDERFAELIQLSEAALTNRTDLLIWPEAAVPKLLRYDKETLRAVTNLASKHHVWMIIGADDAEPHLPPRKKHDTDYFNASFLVSPAGQLVDRYKKQALVIFGEYVPFERWLPFLKFFTPVEGGFRPGDGPVQFELGSLGLKASVLICFEDVFPGLSRAAAHEDTDFLVNITNNGWFGESAAQWQHGATAIFRAVENGLPLIRCSNNGLTCWVDARGRLRQIFRDQQGRIYGQGWLTVQLPLPPAGQVRAPTFYHQHGDWFGWACIVMTLGALIVERVRGRRNV